MSEKHKLIHPEVEIKLNELRHCVKKLSEEIFEFIKFSEELLGKCIADSYGSESDFYNAMDEIEKNGGDWRDLPMELKLLMHLEYIPMSNRLKNCLRANNVRTIDDLLRWSPSKLQDIDNFGRRCLKEVAEIIKYGDLMPMWSRYTKIPMYRLEAIGV